MLLAFMLSGSFNYHPTTLEGTVVDHTSLLKSLFSIVTLHAMMTPAGVSAAAARCSIPSLHDTDIPQ